MNRVPAAILLAFVALLVGGAVSVYAYDSSRSDTIARGVTVGGVHLGGMTAGEARAALRERIEQPLQRPVRVKAAGERYELKAREAKVRTDVRGVVREALRESREGNVLTRSYRALTGETLDVDLPARVRYSRKAVREFVEKIDEDVSRDPTDAEVVASGTGLSTVPAKKGVALRKQPLERQVAARLASTHGANTVTARTKIVKPDVTEDELAEEYPYYITVDRGSFKLRFYRHLELVETYTVAVGQVGYDTPTGLYHIQNKAVDPAWSVPNADWAGDLAGRTIPGGAPKNALKERWLGIYDGAGIHGTDDVGSLGSAASHGCIRMSIPDVIELYERVPLQTPIYIQ